jgi:TonB family protein
MLYWAFVISAITVSAALAQTEPTPANLLNQGIRAFKSANYDQAIQAFQRALELDPQNVNARLYLATAFMTRWTPGATSPENNEFARRAQEGFESVLTVEPQNVVALSSLASLAWNQASAQPGPSEKVRKLEEAAEWNHRVIQVDPSNKEAYYSLGVIAWSKFYPELMQARAKLGMKPETPGPLPDFNTRQDLRARFETIVDEGIRNLEKALELDPAYGDAMAYMNLLIRERGDLRDSTAEYQRDVQIADEWVRKALAAKKSGGGGAPSPPPGPAGAVRVGPSADGARIIQKTEPVYPPLAQQARVQGTVRFQAKVGKDGRIRHLQLVSGHPLLVPNATDAVKQWVYEPVLFNGEPVEFTTHIDVPFRLP